MKEKTLATEDARVWDLINPSNIKSVVIAAYKTRNPNMKLGDNITLLPVVDGYHSMFPDSEIAVFSMRPEVFSGREHVAVIDDKADLKARAKSGSMLLVGEYPQILEHGELNDYLSHGNYVVNPEIHAHRQSTQVFTPGSVGVLGNCHPSEPRTISDTRFGFITDTSGVYQRAKHLMIGVPAFDRPRIPLTDGEKERAEGYLRSLGMSPGGKRPRIFYNYFGHCDGLSMLGAGDAAELIRRMSSDDVEILVNPGPSEETMQAATGLLPSEKGRNVFIPDRLLGVRELFSVLSRFDMVITPNTGTMHAAAAVDVPYVLAHFSNPALLGGWAPESGDCMPILSSFEGTAAGYRAGRLLLSEKGWEIFKGGDEARKMAQEYVGRIRPFNPLARDKMHSNGEWPYDVHTRLLESVKDDFLPFFTTTNGPDVLSNGWYGFSNHVLYRFCALALERENQRENFTALPGLYKGKNI
jgi:hypothetical protein